MKGLNIHRVDEYIQKVAKKSTELFLLAQGDGMEVMMQTIAPQKRFSLDPWKEGKGFEFL